MSSSNWRLIRSSADCPVDPVESEPDRPDSEPAAGSITALISVGLPESIAASTARFNSSGVVALTPTPPNASIILS